MKEVIMKNEFDRNYLMIKENEIKENYNFKMLIQNKIPGLLECKQRYIEENTYYAYDITSKKSLVQEFADRKASFFDLTELFYSLNNVMKQTTGYLLDNKDLWLQPQYIYRDLENKELYCLCFPDLETKREEKTYLCRELADFLLDKIDHKDEHAVNVAYHFYKISKEPYFSFDSFTSFMEKEALLIQAKERREKERNQIEERVSSEYIKENATDSVKETISEQLIEKECDERNEQINWRGVGVLFVTGAIMIGSYLLFPILNKYALYLLVPGLTSIVIGFAVLIRKVVGTFLRMKENEYPEATETVHVEDYFDDESDDVTVFFDQEEYMHLKWKEGRFSKEYLLNEFPVTVGKMQESVQMRIQDPSISRLHARFRKQGNTIYLQDLDSTNGTYVNGRKLSIGEEAIVQRDDQIQFGKIIVNVV